MACGGDNSEVSGSSIVVAEKRRCEPPLRARLKYNRVALMERQTKNSVKPPIGTTDVAGLGLNALDTICIVPRLPEPNGKLRIRDLRVEPGGQVATALVTCTRLGLKARYIGSVGTDHWGKLQLASLASETLELCVREVEGASSQTAVILIEEGIGERTILWHRDPLLLY